MTRSRPASASARGVAREQQAVGGQRQVLDAGIRGEHLDEALEVAPQQRLAARQPDPVDALRRRSRAATRAISSKLSSSSRGRKRVVRAEDLARHAVAAAQVAAVGDRDPQVAHRPFERVAHASNIPAGRIGHAIARAAGRGRGKLAAVTRDEWIAAFAREAGVERPDRRADPRAARPRRETRRMPRNGPPLRSPAGSPGARSCALAGRAAGAAAARVSPTSSASDAEPLAPRRAGPEGSLTLKQQATRARRSARAPSSPITSCAERAARASRQRAPRADRSVEGGCRAPRG